MTDDTSDTHAASHANDQTSDHANTDPTDGQTSDHANTDPTDGQTSDHANTDATDADRSVDTTNGEARTTARRGIDLPIHPDGELTGVDYGRPCREFGLTPSRTETIERVPDPHVTLRRRLF